MPSSTNPVLTQTVKKQAPSVASTRKPSDRAAVANPAALHSSTTVSMHPMTRPLAIKSSASSFAGNVASSAGSSNKQSSKGTASSGPVRIIDFGWREPKPLKLQIGLGLGQFLPSGFLRLPPKYPTIKEMLARAEADAKKSTLNAKKSAANPMRDAAKPTTPASNPTKVGAKATTLAARPAAQNGKK